VRRVSFISLLDPSSTVSADAGVVAVMTSRLALDVDGTLGARASDLDHLTAAER
jgi:hypothetical protein